MVGGRLHRAVDRAARQGARPRARTSCVLEAREVGWAASGRNGGFCAASLTHGFRNGLDRFAPTSSTLLTRLGAREPRRDRGDPRCATASTREFERTGELNVAVAPWQVAELRREAAGAGGALRRQARATSTATPIQAAGALADLPRAACSTATAWPSSTPPGSRGGCGAPARGLGVRIHENTPVDRDSGRRRRRRAHDAVRLGARRAGSRSPPTSSRRCCAASAPYVVPVWDYVLMTEPLTAEQRASIGWAGRQGIGDAAQPVPLLPAHRRRPDPVGRLRRDLLLRQRHGHAELEQRPETFAKLADHFFDHLPAARGRPLQPHRGAGRSTPAPGSARSGGPRTAAGWPTSPATPASASGRRGSAPACCSTCSTAGAPRHPPRSCAASRCRSRPSRSAGPASSSPAGRSTGPTADDGRRNLWLRTLDRLGPRLRLVTAKGGAAFEPCDDNAPA